MAQAPLKKQVDDDKSMLWVKLRKVLLREKVYTLKDTSCWAWENRCGTVRSGYSGLERYCSGEIQQQEDMSSTLLHKDLSLRRTRSSEEFIERYESKYGCFDSSLWVQAPHLFLLAFFFSHVMPCWKLISLLEYAVGPDGVGVLRLHSWNGR